MQICPHEIDELKVFRLQHVDVEIPRYDDWHGRFAVQDQITRQEKFLLLDRGACKRKEFIMKMRNTNSVLVIPGEMYNENSNVRVPITEISAAQISPYLSASPNIAS